jgi:hypothetical protein
MSVQDATIEGDAGCLARLSDVPQTNFRVVGADPHRFDGDGDGRGCE